MIGAGKKTSTHEHIAETADLMSQTFKHIMDFSQPNFEDCKFESKEIKNPQNLLSSSKGDVRYLDSDNGKFALFEKNEKFGGNVSERPY